MSNTNLEQIKKDYEEKKKSLKRRIIICGGTGCIANGSLRVRDAIIREMKNAGIEEGDTVVIDDREYVFRE